MLFTSLSLVPSQMYGQSWVQSVNCSNTQTSSLCFLLPINLGTIDQSTIAVSGAVLDEVVILPQATKVILIYDADVVNNIVLDFDTNLASYSEAFTTDIQVPWTGNFTITTAVDCGANDGGFNVIVPAGQGGVSISYVPTTGTTTQNGVIDLANGNYTVILQDELECPTFDIQTITIQDGSLGISIFDQNPEIDCNSTTGIASGSIYGNVLGTVVGGPAISDDYTFTITPFIPFSDLPIAIDFIYTEMEAGNYNLNIVDNQTGCDTDEPIVIASSFVDLDFTNIVIDDIDENEQQILDLGSINYDFVENPVLNSGATTSWSPTGGVQGFESYTQISVPDTYIATVTYGTLGDCSVSNTFIVDAELCVFSGDFNFDGVVNATDLLIFLGELNYDCVDPANCPTDFNGNGLTDTDDLLTFLGNNGLSWDDVCTD